MGTYKRLPRGKRKPHDEFVDWTIHVILWLKNNWRMAAEIVGVAAVAFAIWIGASTYWQTRSLTAVEDLFQASRLPLASAGQIEKLKEVVNKYSRTPAGWQAMMQLGNIYMDAKDYDRAADEFRALSARSRNHAVLMVAALHRLGEALFAKGDFSAAADTYLKAAADPQNLVANTSRYRAALAFENAGDFERAAQMYRQVAGESKDDDDREVRNASEERLLWLTLNKKISG